jgi:hypothetical protein
MSTKKFIVPCDPDKPDRIIKGFIYPNLNLDSINSFIDIDKRKKWQTGRIVFTGKEISSNEVFS